MNFDWADLAFTSKKEVSGLNATFIAAPREISGARFMQLVKEYLPKGNIVLGLAKEQYINGFDGQPQFRTLQIETVQKIIEKVNKSASPHKIYTLAYFQREQRYIFEKIKFARVVLVNGSWQYSFHMREDYYALVRAGTAYEQVSPFVDENEAKEVEKRLMAEIAPIEAKKASTGSDMMQITSDAARFSFDHTYQTGVALARRHCNGYELLATSFNRVVPYQTYAWHAGPSREMHFSPANDLNYYDAVHAEVEVLILSVKKHINLTGTSFFINLLPCPTCARMLSETDIEEFVYAADHSDGYAIKMLELAGKTVRRVVN